MKNTFQILFLGLFFLLAGCTEYGPVIPREVKQETTDQNDSKTPDLEEKIAPEDIADVAVLTLKEKDMQSLSQYIHPSKGIRFSPYGYVSLETDLVFTAQQAQLLMTDTTVYHWGTFDGSGDPIEMTFTEYYERFVYDHDYTQAEQTAINQRIGQGNTLDNSQEVYPNATIVEYHFSGFDPQYEGMDWRSLRIVLEEEDGKWYIVGIIHDEWTI
ncbi:hypothetical protein [Ammoniphilus sp. 3BR4]|uniref:hypothetical protein n=1 Tax=Ammoniphilus sp. 3BR4 TaxID=3158265 RepID=UPI003465BA24